MSDIQSETKSKILATIGIGASLFGLMSIVLATFDMVFAFNVVISLILSGTISTLIMFHHDSNSIFISLLILLFTIFALLIAADADQYTYVRRVQPINYFTIKTDLSEIYKLQDTTIIHYDATLLKTGSKLCKITKFNNFNNEIRNTYVMIPVYQMCNRLSEDLPESFDMSTY